MTTVRVRKIIHLDLDACFCAVEELDNPSLKGKPFAVGGQPGERGVVASCSYAARQYGVHSAMPTGKALRLCPELFLITPQHRNYHVISERVMTILRSLTPLVEQVSIDEAFLDVTDLPDPPETIARALQARVNAETRLPCSLGVASNKLVAKIATNQGKARRHGAEPPNAILVVAPGKEAEFLAPLPVGEIWGVGPKTSAHLEQMGVRTIGQLAVKEEREMKRLFGTMGGSLLQRARGEDDSPVMTAYDVKSISQEITFARDVSDDHELLSTLRSLSGQVGHRLRNQGLCAATVRIKIRWPDFSTHTRQHRLTTPTDADMVIYRSACTLLKKVREPGKAVRLIGVGGSSLEPACRQPSLWDTTDEKEHRLLEAMDELETRFGKKVVRRGAM